MPTSNLEVAREIQTKLQFYLVGLVFTVLGLAVETSNFDDDIAKSSFELLGWFLLFISGILGIVRFESVYHFYKVSHAQQQVEREHSIAEDAVLRGLGEAPIEGSDLTYSQAEKKLTGDLSRVEQMLDLLSDKINFRYLVHRWLFLLGIGALIVSRGWGAFVQVGSAIRNLVI